MRDNRPPGRISKCARISWRAQTSYLLQEYHSQREEGMEKRMSGGFFVPERIDEEGNRREPYNFCISDFTENPKRENSELQLS